MSKSATILRSVFVFLTLLLSVPAFGATYYVATTGNDDTGDGSEGAPYLTIGAGIAALSSGDTLIVKDGVYGGVANFIDNVPSGSAGAPTTVRAENVHGVRINKGADDLLYYSNGISLVGVSYVDVEGFVIDVVDDPTPPNIVRVSGSDHIKIKKCIIRREGETEAYCQIFSVTTSTYVLAEDCAVVGTMRYGFYVGGTADTSRYIIFRRCVVRNDYSASAQPKASFAVYGNNSGTGVQDVLFQNCMAIDGQDTGYNGGSEGCYGGFYNPKNATGVTYRGSIALNVGGVQGGFVLKELSGTNVTLENSISWDVDVRGFRTAGSQPGVTINRNTIGGNPSGYHDSSSGSSETLTNNLFYNNTALNTASSWNTTAFNAFYPDNQAIGDNAVTSVTITYLPRVESGSNREGTGSDGGNIGATVLYRWGTDNTLWGEAGYDSETAVGLWPWPYEAKLKSVAAETNDPPVGATPETNDTTRGFADNTLQLNGVDNVTLTSYIWEYLGNQMPDNVYSGAATDTTPSAFSFTDQTGVALGSTNNSDNVTVAGIDNTTTLTLTGDASCKYSINGAAWATANDNVSLNDNVALQNVASGAYSTAVSCTLNVGGVTDTWSRTTLAATAAEVPQTFRGGNMGSRR